ncbi:MAG: aspartyl/asparaginyl beta-hydroxylase domain-containing protein [Sphingomonadaceae bacterium]
MSNDEVSRREASATAAMKSGDREGAAAQWQALLALKPDHPRALNAVGNWLLSKGKAGEACPFLERAVAADPDQPALLFNLAMAQRGAGQAADALDSLNKALAIDPYFVQATFQMAILYQETGQLRSAAQVYRNFLDTTPPEIVSAPQFSDQIARAKAVIAADNEALERAILSHGVAPGRRAQEAVDALLGRAPIYRSDPTFLSVPRLPAIPFLDRSLFPWIDALEAATAAIINEAQRVLTIPDAAPFEPYVANPPGTPANQWKDLDHSNAWGAFFLWKHGKRNERNCALCPETAKAIEVAPLVSLDGRAPNAFFSLLKPRTKIPPHTGVTNARLTVHLPLIVPEGCGFRVGGETREWVPGQAWVFDDTIEHEAWNDSDKPRLILIFDVWHPMLDAAERDFFTNMLAAYDDHYQSHVGLTDTL